MAYDIGPRIGIEGEAEFRKAIQDINTSLKTLGTEMQVVTSQFDKNDKSTEALTAKNEVLTKQIEKQKEKLEQLKKGLESAKEKYGENDKVTQGWQQAVNKATAELNNMERELDSNKKALDEMGKKTDETGGRFEKLTGIVKGVVASIGAIAAAAGAAAVKLGKDVVESFADYEQLVGGVETLFKDSSQKLQDYANNAYKTAGLSANNYMETVTSFSASLISSLGGDTEKAVKYADMAITDMADNANKMGTDIQAIQNAYQGFAKQNYTMLDNLKLGYGGTKSEMERLLADAEKISGIKYDISSFADIVEAIHVVQTEMGITGATAREAEGTITGSVNAMKSAWENWIVGLGDANADVTKLTQNLADAFQIMVKNIVPVLENIVAALPTAIDAILTAIVDSLPMILDTVTKLFNQVLETLLTLFPELNPAVVEAVMTIVGALIDNLPLLIEGALQLVKTLADGIIKALPELIPAAVDAILTIVDALIENLGYIIGAALDIIIALTDGLIKALPKLVQKAPEIVTTIVDVIIDNLPLILDAALQIILALTGALIDNIPTLVAAVPDIVKAIFKGLKDGIVTILEFVPELFKSMKNKLNQVDWGEFGKSIINGMVSGIKNAVSGLVDSVVSAAKSALNAAKKVLGIHSPSTVFRDEIGKNLALGLGEGFVNEMKFVAKDMERSIPTNFDINGFDKNGNKKSNGLLGGLQVILQIGEFNNYTHDDLETLSNELAFITKRKLEGGGGLAMGTI